MKEALQAATMWNYIYTPAEYGPFMPVSRQWDFVKFPVNLDWGYVIFDCKKITRLVDSLCGHSGRSLADPKAFHDRHGSIQGTTSSRRT